MLAELFNNPLSILVFTVALLVSLTIHEFSHALVANRLGDPTARLMGRLTLNPLAHLDPIGLLFLIFFRFGWGKPVPFDPFNLRNPRRDSALISLAGPISNLLLAMVLSLFVQVITFFPLPLVVFLIARTICLPIIFLSVSWGLFNLLPIHPLDGFKIVAGLLPQKLANDWQELESYGFVFLLLLILPLAGEPLLNRILIPAVSFVLNILLPGSGTIV